MIVTQLFLYKTQFFHIFILKVKDARFTEKVIIYFLSCYE